MVLGHLLDFLLKLVDQVAALVFKHFDLRFQVSDLGLQLLLLLGSFVNGLLLLLLELRQLLLHVAYLELQVPDPGCELLDLAVQVAIGGLQDVV